MKHQHTCLHNSYGHIFFFNRNIFLFQHVQEIKNNHKGQKLSSQQL